MPDETPTSSAVEAIPPPKTRSDWLIPAVLAAVILGLGALLVLRRRRPAAMDEETRAPSVRAEPSAPPAPAPPIEADAAPIDRIEPPLSQAIGTDVAEPLAVSTTFTAIGVRLSLVYATVQYELRIANHGSVDLALLQVRGDLASAHASLGTREQLAPAPEQLEVKHTIAALAPDQVAELKGEVRVPLQHVVPLVKGSARFFVPLVRFVVIAPNGTAIRRVFTLGPHDPGSAAIAAVRLDAGPRNLRDLDTREIEAARGFALDPMIALS